MVGARGQGPGAGGSRGWGSVGGCVGGGGEWGWGRGEIKPERRLVRLDRREYDSLNPLYLRVREVKCKKRFHSHQPPNCQIARGSTTQRGRGWKEGLVEGLGFLPRLGVAPFVIGGELKRRQGN